MPNVWLLSERPNWHFERNSSSNKLTCLLTCIFFKYFSNDSENIHMIIILFVVSVALVTNAGVGLACLLKICLHLQKNWKSCKCRQEKLFKNLYRSALLWATLRVWKLLSISDDIFFQERRWSLQSNSGIFRLWTGLEKKLFKISTFLASCVKFLSPTSVIFKKTLSNRKTKA